KSALFPGWFPSVAGDLGMVPPPSVMEPPDSGVPDSPVVPLAVVAGSARRPQLPTPSSQIFLGLELLCLVFVLTTYFGFPSWFLVCHQHTQLCKNDFAD